MNDRDDFERRLQAWLDDTARPMPPQVGDDIVASAWRAPRVGVRAAFPPCRRWRLAIGTLAATLAVLVGVGMAFRLPVDPFVGGTPTQSLPVETAPPGSPSATATVPPTAAPAPSASALAAREWHRNNYGAGQERLTCRENPEFWTCDYLVPDGRGSFLGQVVTDDWTCPAWFPRTICSDVTAVYRGYFAIDAPSSGQAGPTPEIVPQEYVITQVGDQAILQLYWVNRFVCPWYRTIDEALAEDYICVFAP
jgi:hypothetical protein